MAVRGGLKCSGSGSGSPAGGGASSSRGLERVAVTTSSLTRARRPDIIDPSAAVSLTTDTDERPQPDTERRPEAIDRAQCRPHHQHRRATTQPDEERQPDAIDRVQRGAHHRHRRAATRPDEEHRPDAIDPLRQAHGTVFCEGPGGVVGDLPGMAVEVEEGAGVATPGRGASWPDDVATGACDLLEHGVHLLG